MKASHRIRGLLLDHFWWKLGALVLACLLWIASADEPEVTSTMGAPVEFKNVPSGLDISTGVTERVMLQLRGPASKLTALAASQRIAARTGERSFTIGPANVQLPADISLVRAVPAQVHLKLERRVQKEVPVHLRFSGPPPAGFRVRMGEVQPERIRIVGPESRVRGIEAVDTDPLDLATVDTTSGEATEVMLNTFLADPHVSPAGSSVIRARVLLERSNEIRH
jgi:hypothetical protein